jgi:acetolactate synthase small subunit
MKNTLCCILQNRLGALDRVLEAMTYRGFIPEQFLSSLDTDTNCLHVTLTYVCADSKTIDKLVKFLNKQVYVLHAYSVESASSLEANVTELFPGNLKPAPVFATQNTRR